MEKENASDAQSISYPVLFLPKMCTDLEMDCGLTENVFIDLAISSRDTEGKEMDIYSGFCNVKLIESFNVGDNRTESSTESAISDETDQNTLAITDQGTAIPFNTSYNNSQVWIDESRSPYVYNRYDLEDVTDLYCSTDADKSNLITVEHDSSFVTESSKEIIHYSGSEVDVRDIKKFNNSEVQNQTSEVNNAYLYESDEWQCGVFLSQLPEEILNENETRLREEMKYIGLQSENNALKQLMSSDVQSLSKQRKTILYLGHNSHRGQTIQKIAINDPSLVCTGGTTHSDDTCDNILDKTKPNSIGNGKKYQCAKCKQIFDQISEFRQHMIGKHKSLKPIDKANLFKFICSQCGKILKSQEKFEAHCLGHGDPDLECDTCHKVFASKFTLKAHSKIHNRKHVCQFCTKSFSNLEYLNSHLIKTHPNYLCDRCEYMALSYEDLVEHFKIHSDTNNDVLQEHSNSVFSDSFLDDVISETDIIVPSPEGHDFAQDVIDCTDDKSNLEIKVIDSEEIREAEFVISKVMANNIFRSKRSKMKCNKICNVCEKRFDRIGDLKRHLIEHIIKSTLAKTPVSKSGILNIQCEVCQAETFTKIDRYKAHLREHAKLTLFKCTFCDKSFSDSSNFSKHKKIHGTTYFQCDLCQRKFNSRRMIIQHLEYHRKHNPIPCPYCEKLFHFKSMLNKHIKCAHTRQFNTRFNCRFCEDYFKSLKEKWDHEWRAHNVRKMIVDCLICGEKFRKYSELKKHCLKNHYTEIPLAKMLLRRNKRVLYV